MLSFFRRALFAAFTAGLLVAQAAGIQAAQDLREEFHQTYALVPDGRVALQNVNGGVHITAWDRNEVKVDAVKTARTAEVLAATEIVVDARADSIAIRTESRDRNHLGNVEYTLMVPRRARLDSIDLVNGGLDVDGVAGEVHGRSVNGGINARGLGTEVDLSTVNGGIRSQFGAVPPAGRIRLNSVNGGVEAALPPGAGAQVKASTLHGGIASDFNLPVSRQMIGQSLNATLGSGGASLELNTVNGGIRIKALAQ